MNSRAYPHLKIFNCTAVIGSRIAQKNLKRSRKLQKSHRKVGKVFRAAKTHHHTISWSIQFTMPTGYVAECRTVKCLGIKCTGNHAASRLIQCQTLGKTDVSVGLSVALLHGLSGVDIPTATLRRSVPHLYYGADDISCNLDDGRNF